MNALRALLMLVVGMPSLWANGSAWQTGVPSSGNVAPAMADESKATTVAIEDERLTIDLHQEFATVEVRYKMQNQGAGVVQGFYFPTERWSRELESYEIEADGKPVKWEEISTGKKVREEDGWGLDASMRSWKYSKIPFKKDEAREVTIRYRQRYARQSHAVSDDGNIGDALFHYSLSPAATWRGAIGKGKVQINVLHPLPERVQIVKPRDRFTKVNDRRYEWSFENLEPTLADDLEVVAQEGFSTNLVANEPENPDTGWSAYLTQGGRYFLLHEDYAVKASSTLPAQGEKSYAADNIKGRTEGGAWVEGVDGDGIGEHLELTIKNPLSLETIHIMPGYAGHRVSAAYLDDMDRPRSELWWKNNRVAGLKVTLNGEYSFNVSIPDEEYTEPYPIPVRGYGKPVKTIRLEITGVHRGSIYRDTCISLVSLQARLAKKPKIQPAR